MKVCIDAGHGQDNRDPGVYDPGAVSDGYKEADIVLLYAQALGKEFDSLGVEVFFTRKDKEISCPLMHRTELAKTAGCDYFISLHCDAFTNSTSHGFTVYHNNNSYLLASKLNEALLKCGSDIDMHGPPHIAPFAVLKFSPFSVLIELGFITNKEDRNKLLNINTRNSVVAAIAKAVISYNQEYRRGDK